MRCAIAATCAARACCTPPPKARARRLQDGLEELGAIVERVDALSIGARRRGRRRAARAADARRAPIS